MNSNNTSVELRQASFCVPKASFCVPKASFCVPKQNGQQMRPSVSIQLEDLALALGVGG
jgi:hypothetical protein